MYKKSLCVVILAAGNSSRFGANKLLYPINNIPMYQYTLNLIKKLNPKQTILVTKYPEITKKIDPNIIVVPNYNTHLDNICALSYKGKRGNPVIFAQKYMPELLTIHGDKGGRVVIQKHLDELTLVEVHSAKELIDIDTLSILNELQD